MSLAEFFASDAGKVVYAVVILAIADFLVGVAAAVRDGTFALDSVAAFLRKHVVGRVFPIVGLLALGYFGKQDALIAVGMAGGAVYLAETIGSIKDSAFPDEGQKQPVPVD